MRNVRDTRIPCSTCHGHGEVALPESYRYTLARLDGKWLDTAGVLARHRTPIVRRTALINRLNALVRWGLVERRGTGRAIEWRRI